MKEPNELLSELADESRDEMTTEQWLDYLLMLQDEVAVWISMTRRDIENKPTF